MTIAPLAKWPNVPACYHWLSLDRRGDWRLQGERVTHRGLIDFINRHYTCDEAGRWFLQNGPQRVFVRLACTPWVFHRVDGGFVSHTGAAAGPVREILLDDDGNILLASELGIGLLDDRDLAQFLAECCAANGQAATEESLFDLMGERQSTVFWQQHRLQAIAAADVAARYGFVVDPQPQGAV
ncbi:MAG: DUF2946 family protein [Azonexus sp.]|jgi:hypothetical protein|nr:DUF2946 family protein [Azonexus sp.]